MSACSQICAHLSEPLYDLVLNMVYDYATTNVRSNAVRAIHQLVECVANANPGKTLAKFLPFVSRNIEYELENGASSLRSTTSSTPLPSDATLHWSELFSVAPSMRTYPRPDLAILRGTVFKCVYRCTLQPRLTCPLLSDGLSVRVSCLKIGRALPACRYYRMRSR